MNHLSNAGSYLSETLFGIILMLVLLRFWMQWVRASFRNPLGQFVISASNPFVLPLRKIIPSIGSADTATLILAFVVALLKTFILFNVLGISYVWVAMFSYALGEVIETSIFIFIGAMLISIVSSWLNPHSYHPIVEIARSISEPLMAPARRLLPPMGGIDFSPILVFIFLNLSRQLIVAPLQ